MPAVMVRNLPERTMEHLKRRAKSHRRSINGEILFILDSAVQTPENPATRSYSPEEQHRVFRELAGLWKGTDSLEDALADLREHRKQSMGRSVEL